MGRSIFLGAFLGIAVALAGCGGSQHPRASAGPSATPLPAISEGDVTRLRAALAKAIAERDAARSQLRTALATQRELRAHLDAMKVAPPERKSYSTAAQTQPQVFTNLSTTQNP